MRRTTNVGLTIAAALALMFAVAPPVQAGIIQNLINNGDFETGDLTGWQKLELLINPGTGLVSVIPQGSPAPLTGLPTTANPAGGRFNVTTDHVGQAVLGILQLFTVPVGAYKVEFWFDLAVDNWSEAPFVHPDGLVLDRPNQHARVDILAGGADPFSTAPGDVVGSFYRGVDPGRGLHDWTSYHFDITGLVAPGATYQARFVGVGSEFPNILRVDSTGIAATLVPIPEPPVGTLLLAGAVGVAVVAACRRRLLAARRGECGAG